MCMFFSIKIYNKNNCFWWISAVLKYHKIYYMYKVKDFQGDENKKIMVILNYLMPMAKNLMYTVM